MTNDRLITLLYNALTYLKDEYGCEIDVLEEELGITKVEYKQIVEDFSDNICCTFGKDSLRETMFMDEKPDLNEVISAAEAQGEKKKTWAEEKAEELAQKPRSEWDENDWNAHNYIENLYAEADYFDGLDDR